MYQILKNVLQFGKLWKYRVKFQNVHKKLLKLYQIISNLLSKSESVNGHWFAVTIHWWQQL